VGPPDENVESLRHLSHKLLVPPVNVVREDETNNINNLNMEVSIIPPDLRSSKARKVKRDDNENEFLESETYKRSVICDDDEESDEKKEEKKCEEKKNG
jgi:hypothetical protein